MKVLIGIATRNRAPILHRAISSALAQDYPETEVAVFDDASTDETPRLQSTFPQVRWFRTRTRQGYISARNHLMRSTPAALYCSLDDDAWFLKGDEIAAAAEVLDRNPNVAALALDILSPDRPDPRPRALPHPTHSFIG